MRASVPLNEDCIEAFDVRTGNGVDAPVTDAPITACFAPPHRPTPSGMTIALYSSHQAFMGAGGHLLAAARQFLGPRHDTEVAL